MDKSRKIDSPTLGEASYLWLKIGILSFGGPAAQIALLHREVVEVRNWLSETQFLNALSFCMLLPGPEAMQLATYAGWRLHGTLGGLIAGLLFVLPGAVIIMALAAAYAVYGDVPIFALLFYGVKSAVLVIVLQALLRIAQKTLSCPIHWLIAGSAFVCIFFLSIAFPIIVLASAMFGWLMLGKSKTQQPTDLTHLSARKTGQTVFIWMIIWLAPLAGLALFGAPILLIEIGQFFSMLAIVTFGGAYAVLAYLAQDAVGTFGWLSAPEMLDALGLAETTPGPLILVTQFVGFLAGFKEGGLWLGLSTAIIVLWVTFVPCFLWIFTGAPYIEWISNQPRIASALEGITAAIVGVILNLSLWFALHVFFAEIEVRMLGPLTLWQPELSSLEGAALGLFTLIASLTVYLKWGVIRILLSSAIIGVGLQLFFEN